MNLDYSSGDALRRAAADVLMQRAADMRRIAREREELAKRLDEVRHNCRTMHGFIREGWHILEPRTPFKDNWHIQAICEHLEAVHRKEISLLVINQPPGTMKSFTLSVMFNPWEWGPGGQAHLRYLTTSYREDLTLRDSRKSLTLLRSEWYRTLWPEVQLLRKGDGEFDNTLMGRRKAIPFLSLTGDRGNRVSIDDPHSLKQAESEVERPATVQHFRETVPSRINDPKDDAIIISMQRMHPEDVCGVIDELGLPAVKLILPMEYVPSLSVRTPYFKDPRTKMGELLHPDRYPRENIEKDKVTLGPHAYDTQFQQRPRARDGSFFFAQSHIMIEKDGSLVPAPDVKRCDSVFAIMDTASKTGAKKDGTGILYGAYSMHPKPQAWLVDYELMQITADTQSVKLPMVLKRCEELAKECGARLGSQGAFIEDKDSGVALLQFAEKKGLNVKPIPSELTALGKEGRALSVSGYVHNKGVLITESCYAKSTEYKGRTKNHLIDQVTTFRMGHGTPRDEDELFDDFCYLAAICFGDDKGL